MTVRKKTRFQSATFNQHKILIKLKKKHYNNKYRHFKLRFESNKIVETSNLKLATTLVWPTLKSAITLFTKDLSFIWLLSSYIKTINFTDLSGVKLNKALICKSIFGLWNFTHFYWLLRATGQIWERATIDQLKKAFVLFVVIADQVEGEFETHFR